MNKVRLIVCCMLLYQLIVHACVETANIEDNEWVEPHAWKRRPTLKNTANTDVDSADRITCPPCEQNHPTTDTNSDVDSAQRIYSDFAYRKLVNYLINEQYMRKDPDSDDIHLHRHLHFHVTRQQYDRIRSPNADLRDIDGWLQDVWQQSEQHQQRRTAELVRDAFWSLSDAGRNFWQHNVLANRWLINIVQVAAGLGLYVTARKHRISIGVLMVALIVFFIYRHLDAECHRKLEIERLADMMTSSGTSSHDPHDASTNPCSGSAEIPWWKRFLDTADGNQRAECVMYLEKLSQRERECDAKTIYDGFMRTFVFGSMEGFFGAIVNMVTNIRSQHGFIAMLLVTMLVYANIGVIIMAIFRYVIGPVIVRFVSGGGSSHSNDTRQYAEHPPRPASTAEYLTSANIERLLNITESNTRLATAMAESFRTQCSISSVETLESVPLRIQAADAGKSTSEKPVSDADDEIHTEDSREQSIAGDDVIGDTASEDDIVILEHFQANSEE